MSGRVEPRMAGSRMAGSRMAGRLEAAAIAQPPAGQGAAGQTTRGWKAGARKAGGQTTCPRETGRRGGAAGFTLLEILVALAVFGFLLAGLSQTVRFGLTAWHQDARLSDGKTDMEAVDRTVRSIVANLAPGDDAGRPSISGTPNSLTGTTRLRVPGSGTTPARIEMGLAVSGQRLVLRWRPFHHGIPLTAPPPAAETELLGGVSRLQIGYWRPPGTWTSTWHEPDLPLLIRFQISFAGAHPARWPEIVVAPLLSRP